MTALCKMTNERVKMPCSYAGCPLFGDCLVAYEKATVKPKTNADHIRSLSDEELADFLVGLADDGNLLIREWLKQPFDGGA